MAFVPTYQIPVRIPEPHMDWLRSRAKKARMKQPKGHLGIATEIKSIIQEAYEKSQKVKRG